MIITCTLHGDFTICSYCFLDSECLGGCKKCTITKKAFNKFKKLLKKVCPKAEIVEDESYDFIDNKTRIKVFCKKHNLYFSATCRDLRSGKGGCKKCIEEKIKKTRTKRLFKELKSYLNKKFPNYELVSTEYVSERDPVLIRCKKHPDELISVTPNRIHVKYKNNSELCDICNKERIRLIRQEAFFEEVRKVHGNEYDLSETYYKKRHNPVIVKCNKCGRKFSIYPDNLIDGKGCPCKTKSSGELKLERWFELNNINYESQVKISNNLITGRKDNWGVVVDFSISYNNINYYIEFNGEQHYVFIKGIHKVKENFIQQIKRDNNLRKYCKENNIVLVEIPWTLERNLFKVMNEIILNGKDPNSIIIQPEISYIRNKNSRRD